MKKHIIVITTGGTIAMKKDPETGGLVPAVSGEDLAAAVPGLSDWADVSVVEFSNVPSGWMSAEKMFDLSHLIDKLSEEGKADGFVVTHGTDTLEETAFFLDMSLKTEKPVCVTGAMRGASELSADARKISSPPSALLLTTCPKAWASSSACRTAFTQPKTSQNPIRPIRTPSAI